MEGDRLANHADAPPSYIPNLDPGRFGGGTYTSQQVEPTLEAYENIFGPSARDIKQDLQRFKRHGRWHLPDILKGPNQYLTDRIDGLITDAQNSPFTSRILPYKYITNVDGKIKWNVWSFDEGLSSRVPYESAARTLTQTKRSYAGYTIRQGMAIVLEHNFMMTEAGRTNFRNQLNQLIGSIQLTNDLDVHVALVLAPSYQKTMQEKYLTNDKTPTQICREFVDMFGFVQKNQNALDILIEEAKGLLRTWGAPMPNFMLCNSKLTFQLTMTPDVTNYVANGPEGAKRLRSGPDLQSYRGINIIHTRAFSMETGAPPRDILRRRVRVAEYYRILPHRDNWRRLFQLYNEERDTWSTFTFADLLQKALCDPDGAAPRNPAFPGVDNNDSVQHAAAALLAGSANPDHTAHGAHPAAPAPALGIAMDNPHVALRADTTELYRQIFEDQIACSQFVWEPIFVHPNIVFVPGATDRLQNAIYDDFQANFAALPTFVRQALKETHDRLVAAAVAAPIGHTENHEISFKVQSVAQYPRNIAYASDTINHVGAITAIYHGSAFPNVYLNAGTSAIAVAAAAAPALPAVTRNAQNSLRRKLGVRNFMRYGVSNTARRPAAAWGSRYGRYAEVFDLNTDPALDNPLDQHLRNKGAFGCPNHFQGGNMAAPVRFNKLADYLGYNVVLTEETVEALTVTDAAIAGNDPYTGCALYDLVLNARTAKYRPLLNAVQIALNNEKARIAAAVAAGGRQTRADVSTNLMPAILAAFAGSMAAVFTGNSKVTTGHMSYWLWPQSNDVSEDVFGSNQPWATRIRGLAGFQNELEMNDAVLTAIAAGGFPNNEVFTSILDTSTCTDATPDDAIHFFHMLAWRMWADQEVPLDAVYQAHGVWPDPAQYLHPVMYTLPFFGGTVMRRGPAIIAPGAPGGPQAVEAMHSDRTKDIEVVIIRPNIEHYMLGIILGQGGESLGSTFWGQTELSCYDDSMHGIWGMSYKYNERAIVINERNLVRLWDIAYDGYVGGKEDSAVNWNDHNPEHPNSLATLGAQTMDVTQAYRGPSMMVMAFNHRAARMSPAHRQTFQDEFKTNWPSPIVFYDKHGGHPVTLPMDFDNIHVADAKQFRVFDKEIYHNAYQAYCEKMPNFWELHKIRKNAGLAAVENEVSSDALAFQGTMRTLSADNGQVVAETMGSGHHGPDFIGVASLRAGKGYKINSQPTLQRTI